MKKKTLFIYLAIVLAIIVLVFGIYNWQKSRYIMPRGYGTAVETWQQMGLEQSASRVVDGSAEHPFDVVVWGTDPEGIAAAVAAARNGLHTLLVDHRDVVGGLFTLGRLNFIDMNDYDHGRLVTRGIFEEFYTKVGGVVFDIKDGQRVFEEMIYNEPLLVLDLNNQLVEPVLAEDNKVTYLRVEKGGEQREVHGKIFIDASQDADLAYQAGVPFTVGFEDMGMPGHFQVSTLVFNVTGINWPRVMWETLAVDRRRGSAATFSAAWGLDNYVRQYESADSDIAFRGFNMARQQDGQVLLNGLLIHGVDINGPATRSAAKEKAYQEAYRFIEFARENIPGFKNAEVKDFAEELYVRQSRQMKGLYRLTIDDVLENRDHWDRIGYGSYPVDIQSISRGQPGFVVGTPLKYALPFRCLVPPGIDNLLVVGRSASYDSLAQGSVRVVPPGMVAGQAAGVASAYSLAVGETFTEMARNKEAISFIRDMLEQQGAYVEPSNSKPGPETGHPDYDAVKELRRLGMALGGYRNDYKLDEPVNGQTFMNLLYNCTFRWLNLSGRVEDANKLYFVTTTQKDEVASNNISELVDEFERFNPHLKELYARDELEQLFQSIEDSDTGSVILRGQIYRFISNYLKLIASN